MGAQLFERIVQDVFVNRFLDALPSQDEIRAADENQAECLCPEQEDDEVAP